MERFIKPALAAVAVAMLYLAGKRVDLCSQLDKLGNLFERDKLSHLDEPRVKAKTGTWSSTNMESKRNAS